MAKINLKDNIVVKTKTGEFRLLKKEGLDDLPQDDLIVPQDDIVIQNNARGGANILDKSFPKAKFYFSVDDENDVERMKQKKDEGAKNQNIKEFIDEIVLSIINKVGVTGTQEKDNQLKSVIISCLRGVRTTAQTKEALSRLNIGAENIEMFLDLIKEDKPKVEESIRTGEVPEFKRIKKIEPEINKKIKPVIKPTIEAKKEQQPAKPERKVGVRAVQQTVGLAGEIESVGLADFRKMGNGPGEAVQRIWDKIELLEDESLLKRAEGVQAWHRSEPYQLYLQIGAESISKHKSVEEVIASHAQAGDQILTIEEFNEIADLNKRLNY